ncbi:lamin tail domain-containing protein [Verrucomicrobiaceae bacterium N1E253]|uniref:Lamin tail domain-containing protein n=1 Tax=Oceaniferula marina TaxID=2748318 RepID=A0A851GJV7_9BACT|nr:lamin tail domain-containing protein [Oceaniferula marina]NWK54990.1 lamin tail domain-containing protein [Oceaniferula marina]
MKHPSLIAIVVSLWSFVALSGSSLGAAPIAGSDFSTSTVFDAAGGQLDISLGSSDDLAPDDHVTVSDWVFVNGGKFLTSDSAAIGMPSGPATKIDGGTASQPTVGSLPAADLNAVSFSIHIPADTIVDLSSVTWLSRQATDSTSNARWIAFKTSLDTGLIYSEVGSHRYDVDTVSVDLTGAAYQGLTDTTVTFTWYAGGSGSGDQDFDTPVVHGDVRMAASDPPTVTNANAVDINPTFATFGGEVTETGGANPTVTLYWGDHDGGTTAEAWDHFITLGNQDATFSTGVSGLTPSTTYYFRCFASNSAGQDWADSTASFTTGALPDPPVVVNHAASEVSYIEAYLNGAVTGTGGETPNVTIYYGDNDGGTVATSWDHSVSIGAQSGAFTTDLFGLTHNTTYYYRAFAQNSGGSAWASASGQFTTAAFSLPTVAHSEAGHLTGTSAQIGGSIVSTGGSPPEVTLYWGDNDGGENPLHWDASVSLGEQSSDFSSIVTGLNPLTTYYFRVYVENEAGSVWVDSTASFTTLELSALLISEFMASNDGGDTHNTNTWYPIANQVPGSTDDWIEIHNTSSTTLDLGGWKLTDSADELNQWTFPSATTIVAGGYLVVYASGANSPDANGNLHTNFKLSAKGEYLALVRPSGTVASEFGPSGADYPPQDKDVSYGLHPSLGASVYFSSPTPGAANDSSGITRVEAMAFSPDRGYYQTAIEVTLSNPTPGATIYYTTDGSKPIDGSGNPTATAAIYTTPVPVTQTTAVRAAAVKAGYAPTTVDTRTYLLLDIDHANADGTDSSGLNTAFLQQTQPAGWGSLTSGDYNMNTAVSQSTATATHHSTSTAQTMLLGMRDIPTLSIAMNHADFSGSNGIYTNSTDSSLEHECSAEFIPARGDTRNDWQVNCGIKVQGGASRNPSSSPKHSMNFRFREEYGTGRLNQALFPGSNVEEFNSLALRAGYNNSWIHRDAGQRGRGSMIRDQWMRQSMLDMGSPAAGHGMMVHIFVNGLYWGVHNLCERPEASHYASYNGGDDDLLDARNGGSVVDGNATAWNEVSQVVADGDWTKIQGVIDMDQYIDYQIINRYGANHDLKSNGNWRAAGGGPFPEGQPELMQPWQLYSWDGERTLESETATNAPVDPMGVRSTLETHAEYKMRFADRVQKHFFNDGSLTPGACADRWMKYANNLDRAIIAESARWGNHRRTPAYTRDGEWLTEQSRLIGSYFPVRTSNVLGLYVSEGLFPQINAPEFLVNGSPQHGGEIAAGGILTLTAGSGTIYYTLDGSDPRLEGGAVNPSAIAILSGQTVNLPSSQTVKTRLKEGDTWSALNEATFFLEALALADDLVLTEIHYHPSEATAVELAAGRALAIPRDLSDADVFEFVEIKNISSYPVNLAGVHFGEGLDFTFGNTVLNAGAMAVLVRDAEAFAIRYPGVPIVGSYEGGLSNSGEQISLILHDGGLAQSLIYSDQGQWPGRADGEGSSLELIHPTGEVAYSESWRSSSEFHGSPGVAGKGLDQRVVINEVFTHSELQALDQIELHNTTEASLDISGWVLSDRSSTYRSFRVPNGTVIAAGAYVTFDESDFNVDHSNIISTYSGVAGQAPTAVTSPSHGLTTGDVVTLSGYGGFGGYNGTFEVTVLNENHFSINTEFLDNHASKGTWTPGRPFSLSSSHGDKLWLLETTNDDRLVGFVDQVDFEAAFAGESLGRWPNGAGTGTLVTMTENTFGRNNAGPVMGPVVISELMYAPAGSAGDLLEFVELYNTGDTTEHLDHWTVRGGADFDFTSAHSLEPGGCLVLVSFDPLVDVAAAAIFRAAFGIDSSVQLVGPFLDGPLDKVSGAVRLRRPDSPPEDDPEYYPQVTEDEVRYSNASPWPVTAAGSGDSLHRVHLYGGFGNFASSWSASTANPGTWAIDYLAWSELFFGDGSPEKGGPSDDFDSDGVVNLMEYALGMHPLQPDHLYLPTQEVDGTDSVFTYTRSITAKGIDFKVYSSTDLITWKPETDRYLSSDGFFETREVRIPTGGTKQFIRLKVSQSP